MKWSEVYPTQFNCHANFDDDSSCNIEGDGRIWNIEYVSIGYIDVLIQHHGSLEECKQLAEAAYKWAKEKYPTSYFEDPKSPSVIYKP